MKQWKFIAAGMILASSGTGAMAEPVLLLSAPPPEPILSVARAAEPRSPWLASTLSLAGSGGILAAEVAGGAAVAGSLVNWMAGAWNIHPTSEAVNPFLAAAPMLGLGLGYAYARDLPRGLMVGAGSALLVSAAYLGGVQAYGDRSSLLGSWAAFNGLAWAVVVGAICTGIAMIDVASTTSQVHETEQAR